MKSYNVQNYIRYKQDLKQAYKRLPQKFDYRDYTRDELIILFNSSWSEIIWIFSFLQDREVDRIKNINKKLILSVIYFFKENLIYFTNDI